MVGDTYSWLPIRWAACFGHAMTPSVFATLLALTSAVGLRMEDCDGRTAQYYLQRNNMSPHKVTLMDLYNQALADHAAFEARYHPLVSVVLFLRVTSFAPSGPPVSPRLCCF